ncbi:hypothetical protein ACP275_06G112400 [Erythranthe tilingii]
MMPMRTKNDVFPPESNGGRGGGAAAEKEWELRPGGMLVQKRIDGDQARAPPPTIRVRVKHASIYHEIRISSQASFGELKKMLSGPTGLHHEDQKLFYKDKERDNKSFLDTVGIKDKSKIVLQEDPISQEKRILAMRKNVKMEKAVKTVSEISSEVDKLAQQVSALESIVSKGKKVVEKDVVKLIELLMNQLLKLDGIIVVDSDVKLQRKMQVTRIQKCVETLDVLKLKNSAPTSNENGAPPPVQLQKKHSNGAPSPVQLQKKHSNGAPPVEKQRNSNGAPPVLSPVQDQQARHSFGESLIDSPHRQEYQPRRSSSGGNVVITTQWETFDAPPTSTAPIHRPQPSFTWDLL